MSALGVTTTNTIPVLAVTAKLPHITKRFAMIALFFHAAHRLTPDAAIVTMAATICTANNPLTTFTPLIILLQ